MVIFDIKYKKKKVEKKNREVKKKIFYIMF